MKKLLLTLLSLSILSTQYSFAQQSRIDSFLTLLKTDKPDTEKVIILNNLCHEYMAIGSYNDGLKYGNMALQLAKQLNKPFSKVITSSYHGIGTIYYYQGNYPEALKNYFSALKIQEQISTKNPNDRDNKKGIAATYNNIGLIYWNQNNYKEALKNYIASLKIGEELGDKQGVADSYNNIGNIYANQGDYQVALKNYFASLKIQEDIGEKYGAANAYNNIGAIYMDQAEAMRKSELNHKADSVLNKLTDALKYYLIGLKLYEEIGNKNGSITSFINLGAVYIKLAGTDSRPNGNRLNKAKDYLDKAIKVSKEIGNKDAIKDSYAGLAILDSTQGDFKAAFENHKQYIIYRDSINNEEAKSQMIQSAMTYDFEKKELATQAIQDKKDAVVATEKRRQGYILLLVSCFLVLVFVFAVFAYRSYLQKRRANKTLEEKNIVIAGQKKIVEEKSLLITDSIEYAKSIQDVILPEEALLNEKLADWFVFFKPKDVVSGDFYWAKPVKDKIFIAAIDCTGHGVPGAFMSLMAFNMLENIIIKKEFSQPSLILDELNAQVLSILHQQTENASAKYGMDITLIEIDRKNNKVEFAGAHNPLLIVSQNENFSPVREMPKGEGAGRSISLNAKPGATLNEVKADKTTIGMAREKFTNHTLAVQKGDMLYLFTDGYPDQKGGAQNKKFFAATFKELLVSVSQKDCHSQKEVLQSTFSEWKGAGEQIDDVLVMGLRI